MSLDYEVDRDPADETREAELPVTGLCTRCLVDAALPADEWCRDCIEEWTATHTCSDTCGCLQEGEPT